MRSPYTISPIDHALETAYKVVLMKNGVVVILGTPEEVYESSVLDEVSGVKSFGSKRTRSGIISVWRNNASKTTAYGQ